MMLRMTAAQFLLAYDSLMTQTRACIDGRYPCGAGEWIHYRVTAQEELDDILRLARIKIQGGSGKMTANEYQKEALRTLNPELDKKDVLINGVMGLCGEAGECIDVVKKHLAQGHELDRENLIKELGDVAWYLAETAYALDVELDEVLQRNLDKLRARYPQGFDEERSKDRTAEE